MTAILAVPMDVPVLDTAHEWDHTPRGFCGRLHHGVLRPPGLHNLAVASVSASW